MTKKKSNKPEPVAWRNRIVSEGSKPASQFHANPLNYRTHPMNQRAAVNGSLNELGWIQRVIVNRTTGNLVDGHERVWQALQANDADVPFIEVELSEGEERLALAIYDPLSAMAETDAKVLDDLLREVRTGDAALQELLTELAEDVGIVPETELSDLECGDKHTVIVSYTDADVDSIMEFCGKEVQPNKLGKRILERIKECTAT
jgi:hypothetical protein